MKTLADYEAETRHAFENALATGRLSNDKMAANYVGHYMCMGRTTDGLADAFKHSLTRKYLPREVR